MVRADHSGNIKRGGVCIYFKEFLPVHCLPNPYLKECLIFEVSINSKRGYVVSVYRSPSQTSDDFNSFTTNLEKLQLNAKSSNWSSNDTATAEGNQLDNLTSLYGMKQVITEPTHILENSSSCIDLS